MSDNNNNNENDFEEYGPVEIDENQEIESNIVNLFTRETLDAEYEILKKKKRKECLKRLYETEESEPTDLLILSYNEDNNGFAIRTTHNSIGEMLHMIELAKKRLLEV